jgi:hypothetical protein
MFSASERQTLTRAQRVNLRTLEVIDEEVNARLAVALAWDRFESIARPAFSERFATHALSE